MLSDEQFTEIRREWVQTLKRTDTFKEPDAFKFPRRTDEHPFEFSASEMSKAVARHLKVPLVELLGKGTTTELCRKRIMLYRVIREAFPMLSYFRIGKLFGKDHSSVIHGERRALRLYATDDTFKAQYDTLAGKVL